MSNLTSSFRHLSPATLVRAAEFMEHGGRPDWLLTRIASRAYRIAGNTDDAVALLHVAADR